ncbi:MAG: hypothetical protein C4527_17220 [Candidatus Omnitrophota bacterium]|nr:MAG: hypothetical protein C4527_17220 [Candidatus Omnitrophota bacterium]
MSLPNPASLFLFVLFPLYFLMEFPAYFSLHRIANGGVLWIMKNLPQRGHRDGVVNPFHLYFK